MRTTTQGRANRVIPGRVAKSIRGARAVRQIRIITIARGGHVLKATPLRGRVGVITTIRTRVLPGVTVTATIIQTGAAAVMSLRHRAVRGIAAAITAAARAAATVVAVVPAEVTRAVAADADAINSISV